MKAKNQVASIILKEINDSIYEMYISNKEKESKGIKFSGKHNDSRQILFHHMEKKNHCITIISRNGNDSL